MCMNDFAAGFELNIAQLGIIAHTIDETERCNAMSRVLMMRLGQVIVIQWRWTHVAWRLR